MDPSDIEEKLRRAFPGAVLIDPRLLRRVIKAHKNLDGLSFSIPHERCYALRRDALLSLAGAELGSAALLDKVVLVARPAPREMAKKPPHELMTQLLRAAFHGQVHLRIEQRIEDGALTDAAIRACIDRIGQTEFDEIRATLRHDDLLLPPYGDREVYAEFAALYLELRHFAPGLLPMTFPGLLHWDRVDEVLARDVDVRPPEGLLTESQVQAAAAPRAESRPRRPPAHLHAKWLLYASSRARERGQVTRAVLHAARAVSAQDPDMAIKARDAVQADLGALADRLGAALRPAGPGGEQPPSRDEWVAALTEVATSAVSERSARRPSARLIEELERAARESEEEPRAVDLVTWALSRGKTPLVRGLPATREIRIARRVRSAMRWLWQVPAFGERKLLVNLLRWAQDRADANVSAVLRPRILDVLAAVGLQPGNLPERIAQYKLIEELLDQGVERGFIQFAHLRDAIARNQLKLEDLARPHDLVSGDPLLRADAMLASRLDGVYRRGEVYLRFLQKVSSVAFGTRVGRFLSLYAILPLGGSFVILEGVGHLIAPIARALGVVGSAPVILTPVSFLVTAALVFALVHSEIARRVARGLFRIVARVLGAVFLRIPRWVLTRPSVRAFLRSRPVRFALRRIVFPAMLTALVVLVTPLSALPLWGTLPSALALFALSSWAFDSRAARLVEDVALDWLGPTWRTLRGQLLPGLFRLIAGLFRFLMDTLERAIHRVDEWFRVGQQPWRATIAFKAGLGLVWFVVAYVVRLYTTLLVEPELNPIKHFPVVTVAHKLLLPFSPEMLAALNAPLSVLGPVVGGAVAATTVFLLPSVFGFLVWEFQENRNLYRASRTKSLHPVRVGHHGETMGRLMVPGFHSGTLPKLYDRLRRAVQRAEDEEDALLRFREGISSVSEAIERFVTREWLALLYSPANETPRWTHGPLEVERILLGSNRVRIRIVCPALGDDACEIAFDEQSGLLVASVSESGFLGRLRAEDDRVLFENALAGFYHLAGVDLVREEIQAMLGATVHYDISDEGLVIWPDPTYRTEVIYPLRGVKLGATIEPQVRGAWPVERPPVIDERRFFFRHRPIPWADWQRAWDAAARREGPIPRLMSGSWLIPSEL
ncbi:hypothetical protein LVJ94_29280 [Pendulispora rubella]|uniref:Uncharacterized protein n=1 Tax=Pendulispora rubella TaxID=2741070 RepID=A0ABZ2KSI1_9BACT